MAAILPAWLPVELVEGLGGLAAGASLPRGEVLLHVVLDGVDIHQRVG